MSNNLLQQLEQAFDSGILVEFIANYIGTNCGTLSEIESVVAESIVMSKKDIDEAMKMIEMKNLLPQRQDPYKLFVLIYNDARNYEDWEVKNMLAAVYFPHMGNTMWDNAYEKILSNFESLKPQTNERKLKYNDSKRREVDNIMNEALDRDILTVQDLISNEIDNVSDDRLDADIRLYKFIAHKLGVADYNKLFVAVDDGNYNPEWLLEDGMMIPYKDHKLFKYESANMIAEFHVSGNIFMYFVNESDASKYFDTAEKFLDEFDVDENPFNESMEPETEVVNKRWTIGTNDTACTLESLQMELNRRDKATNNKYDLLNKFLQEARSLATRKELVEKINSNASDEEISNYLSPAVLVEDVAETIEPTPQLETRLEQETKVNGGIEIDNEVELNRAIDWLVTNGIDYDIEHTSDNTYRIDWYVGVDSSTSDKNKELAQQMKDTLLRVVEMVDDILNSLDAARAAFYNNEYIKETLNELLNDCNKFEY